jgi:hypothetical protein
MPDVKPTPSQEENDLAAMGQNVTEKEHDGSPPEEPPQEQMEQRQHQTRAMQSERQPGGRGYETRRVQPRQEPKTEAAPHRPEPSPPRGGEG